jgi:hypothetical protein
MRRTGLWIPVLIAIVVGMMAVYWTRSEHDVPRPVTPAPGETPVLTPPPDIPADRPTNPEDHGVK